MGGDIPGSSSPDDFDIAAVLERLDIHLQPIVDLATGTPLAMEALARFGQGADAATEAILAAAHGAGYGYTLEAACLRAALARRGELPDGVRLAVNISPDVLHHPGIERSWVADLDGVIIEITEHWASRPAALPDQFAHLRRAGAEIAVDDVGTGYAGLLRLATMRPDYVKIDRTIVARVRHSEAQSAVLEALVTFSHRTGAAVIGEGVESFDGLKALAEFDVDYGQGWAIGRPEPTVQPIDRFVVEACQQARRSVLERRAALGAPAAYAQAMHAVTSAVSNATGVAGLHVAADQAAAELSVDAIGVSVLDGDGILREITSSGAVIDTSGYALSDYPVTRAVFLTGNPVEVHLNDPDADPAERAVLERRGYASLLIIPFAVGDQPIGILEFAHRTHRRWTTHDIAHGRGLATHLGNALLRINS
jgi:EAL domain-containing protein (putative c-di-GMP-specific phosphodiesterase class I)